VNEIITGGELCSSGASDGLARSKQTYVVLSNNSSGGELLIPCGKIVGVTGSKQPENSITQVAG
jgi:hypothetical protein